METEAVLIQFSEVRIKLLKMWPPGQEHFFTSKPVTVVHMLTLIKYVCCVYAC